jgi:hypothetical protein
MKMQNNEQDGSHELDEEGGKGDSGAAIAAPASQNQIRDDGDVIIGLDRFFTRRA